MNERHYIGYSSLLDASDKHYYRLILEAIRTGNACLALEGNEPEHAVSLLQIVLCDHPELYWANLFAKAGGLPPKLEFVFPNEVARTPETDFRLNDELNRITADLPAVDSEYELAKAAYAIIASRSEYGESGVDENDPAFLRAHSCIGCLLDHRAVCEGVAKAMQLLLHRLGITAYLVCGTATNAGGDAEAHAWLLVEIEGSYYYMDPTWGGCSKESGMTSYSYFLMCDDDVLGNYEPDSPGMLPICDYSAGTYFAREGLLINSWSEREFERAIAKRLDGGEHRDVELKFSTQQAYEAAKTSIPNDENYVRILRRIADPDSKSSALGLRYSFADDFQVLSLMVAEDP